MERNKNIVNGQLIVPDRVYQRLVRMLINLVESRNNEVPKANTGLKQNKATRGKRHGK